MADLVTLEIHFISAPGDNAAGLYWISGEGNATHYTDLRAGSVHRQDTYPGHRWALKGNRSDEIIWETEAAAHPAVQTHTIDIAAADAPGSSSGGPAEDESTEAVHGTWVSSDGLHRFERNPRHAGQRTVEWRELDAQGTETARLLQLEVRVDTRWLWWVEALFAKLTGMSGEREYMLMTAGSVASAYQLDNINVWPQWLLRHIPHPGMTIACTLCIGGALVAAALPLTESKIVLHNLTARVEVRLDEAQGFSRQPSTRPGYPNQWVKVCDGKFEAVPQDLRLMQKDRRFHVIFCTIVACVVARMVWQWTDGMATG